MNSFDPQAQLPGALRALGLGLSPSAQNQLLAHLSLIAKWNRVYNLTAVRDPAEMFTHHLLDSLAAVGPLARHLRSSTQRNVEMRSTPSSGPSIGSGALSRSPGNEGQPLHLLDVGAGAGLPGVALAIALPEAWSALMGESLAFASTAPMGSPALPSSEVGQSPAPPIQVTCVDAVAKKAGFIRQVAAELGLSHLQAVHGRIETLALPAMDVITCRAFASLADIVRLTRRHLAPGGVWMALKGAVPQDEMAELPVDVEVFHVEPLQVPLLAAQRCLVWMRCRTGPA